MLPGNQHLTSRDPWVPQAGYVLVLRKGEMEVLEEDLVVSSICSKAIPKIPSALRRKAMLCFVSAQRGKLTHIARATVLYAAESGRDRLDIWNVTELAAPISLAVLARHMEGRQAWRAKNALVGGHLSKSAFGVFLAALAAHDADAHASATGLIDAEGAVGYEEPSAARVNWAYQRDAVVTALKIAGITVDKLGFPASPPDDPPDDASSIFDSEDDATTIEDLAILQDLDTVGEDWEFVRRQRYPAKTYRNGDTKLTVILANKLELEKQLGVDLVYYNETFHAATFVQYKMFRGEEGEEGYRPDGQLGKEIARMEATARRLATLEADETCDGYRIGADPFFLKFCSKLVPSTANGHVPGIYVTLGYWKLLAEDPRTKGVRGGTVVYDETFGRRRLTSTAFTDLVGRGWIGTAVGRGGQLFSYLREALEGRKGVVFAVQSTDLPDDDQDDFDDPPPRAPRKKKERYPGRPPKKKVWTM